MKHVIILSSKSSGSTALQNYLKNNLGFTTVNYTQHQEEETLYWSKVASILGLGQKKMYYSNVPFSANRAVEDLNMFFKENDLSDIHCSLDTTEEEFQEYYFRLMKRTGSKFVEKSPHHLYNDSNLELIKNFREQYRDQVEVVIIGLVRHPHAVVFSAWDRWKCFPEYFEEQWANSYENLLKWKEKLNMAVVSYEDMVNYKIDIPSLVNENVENENYKFRSSSMDKWKNTDSYGFKLSKRTKRIAKEYGYLDLKNDKTFKWLILKNKYAVINMLRSIFNGRYYSTQNKK